MTSAGRSRRTSPGNVSCRGCSGSSRYVAQIVTVGEAAEGDVHSSVAVVLGWAVPRRHADHATHHPANDIVLAIASSRAAV